MSRIKLKLKYIDPIKYGVLVGILMFIMSVLMFLFGFLIMSIFGVLGNSELSMFSAILGGGFITLLIAPLLYGVFGFIIGLLGAYILNFVLGKTNGLDVEFEGILKSEENL